MFSKIAVGLLCSACLLVAGAAPIPKGIKMIEKNQDKETTTSLIVYASDNTVEQNTMPSPDFADANLLDVLRGKESFGFEAFAIVTTGDKTSFVYIENNCTVWATPLEFFKNKVKISER